MGYLPGSGLAIAAGRAYAFVCSATLFVLLGLTVVDVGGREVLNRPLPGGYEVSELVLLVLFFLALPATTARDEHITVTLIDRWLPDGARHLLAALGDLLTAAMLAALAPFLWRHAQEVAQYGDVTLYLQIQTAPFVSLAAAMTLLASVLAAVRFVTRAARELGISAPGR